MTNNTIPFAAPASAASAQALLARLSGQLDASRQLLEERVAELSGQLVVASEERLQQLAEKERLARRLRQMLDLLPGGVVVIDGQGVVREVNPVAEQLLGEPLLNERWRDVIERAFAPRADDGHEVSLRDGRRLSIAIRGLEDEPGQLILLTDLTETRRLQEQLARHQRLSELGRMVAGLAHQIRTPLSAALLYAGHLSEQALPLEQQMRFAGRLKERLHELERQVRDMLVFARGELPLSDRITPGELFEALRQSADALLGDHHPLRWQCDARDGLLLCSRDTLVGALLNLIDNALRAGGSQVPLKIHLYRRGDQLRLAISDGGPGMDAATLARLGEPFFTRRGNGTGLGVAVARAVAQAHHGRLEIRSRQGFGTCALLILPCLEAGRGQPEEWACR